MVKMRLFSALIKYIRNSILPSRAFSVVSGSVPTWPDNTVPFEISQNVYGKPLEVPTTKMFALRRTHKFLAEDADVILAAIAHIELNSCISFVPFTPSGTNDPTPRIVYQRPAFAAGVCSLSGNPGYNGYVRTINLEDGCYVSLVFLFLSPLSFIIVNRFSFYNRFCFLRAFAS